MQKKQNTKKVVRKRRFYKKTDNLISPNKTVRKLKPEVTIFDATPANLKPVKVGSVVINFYDTHHEIIELENNNVSDIRIINAASELGNNHLTKFFKTN